MVEEINEYIYTLPVINDDMLLYISPIPHTYL
jgi:hypothetical protein